MALKLERKLLLEFIDCYRRHPELWDHNREDYGHKVKKEKAYGELLKILKKLDPDSTDLDVRRKINGFRGGYRREKKKQNRLMQQYGGITPQGEETLPTLWWYNHFTFMDPIYDNPQKRMKTDLSFLTDAEDSQPAMETFKESPRSEVNSVEEDPFSTGNYNYVEVSPASPSDVKRFNQSNVQSRESLHRETNHIKREQTSFSQKRDEDPSEDPSEIYARAWALQFKQLSADQKIFAKKSIDDILFEASLGTLRRHSVKINDSLCQHCQTTFLNNEYEEEMQVLVNDC